MITEEQRAARHPNERAQELSAQDQWGPQPRGEQPVAQDTRPPGSQHETQANREPGDPECGQGPLGQHRRDRRPAWLAD